MFSKCTKKIFRFALWAGQGTGQDKDSTGHRIRTGQRTGQDNGQDREQDGGRDGTQDKTRQGTGQDGDRPGRDRTVPRLCAAQIIQPHAPCHPTIIKRSSYHLKKNRFSQGAAALSDHPDWISGDVSELFICFWS